MTSPILLFDHKIVDVQLFRDLVGERYIDSFHIDVSISKYIEESYLKGQDFTFYLLTGFFQWMQVQGKDFKLQKVKERTSQIALFDNAYYYRECLFMLPST